MSHAIGIAFLVVWAVVAVAVVVGLADYVVWLWQRSTREAS